jgi:hypothetical protein
MLPSSLFITGVTGRAEHATFGGGFGDIYQAKYSGKTVALKHIRTLHSDSEQRRIRLVRLYFTYYFSNQQLGSNFAERLSSGNICSIPVSCL